MSAAATSRLAHTATRLSLALSRLGLQKLPAAASTARTREQPQTARSLLRTELTRSLVDGTPARAAVASRFEELSKLVCAILGHHHHELAVRLQETYRSYDPSEPPPPNGERPPAAEAAAFSKALHSVLRGAGFRLCTREDEAIGVEDSFGNDDVWNVPTAMSWSELDESLVRREQGGFDAYAAEAEAGRAVSRPTWGDKLIVYNRGVGILEKRGYYLVPKIEEMVTRRAQAFAARMQRPIEQRINSIWQWAEQHVAAMRPLATRLGLVDTEPRADGAAAAPPLAPPASEAASDAAPSEATDAAPTEPAEAARRSLQSVEISMRTLFEETTLRTPTHGHVLLAFRHSDAEGEARDNEMHIALALFRDVPTSDLDMLLPHTQVMMPGLQRAQFGAMGLAGLVIASPLMYEHTLSVTGVVTLYTLAAFAMRNVIRWRNQKLLYQQQLLSYQNSNRVGSADGALLCVARLAEQEQTKQALLLLHSLLRAQLDADAPPSKGGERPDGSRSTSELTDESRRVMRSWSQLAGLECHVDDDWQHGPLPLLLSMGVVERASTGLEVPPDERAQMRVRLRPLDEALAAAEGVWRQLGATSASPSAVDELAVHDAEQEEQVVSTGSR